MISDYYPEDYPGCLESARGVVKSVISKMRQQGASISFLEFPQQVRICMCTANSYTATSFTI